MPGLRPRRVVDRLGIRLAHLDRLALAEDNNFVVTQANEAFKTIHSRGPSPASIVVRDGFIARPKRIYVAGEDETTTRPKPPIANLIRSQGLALRLELALIFLAQCNPHPGRKAIPLPVSAASQDDDEALGLINLFATGTRHRGGSNYRRRAPAMRARQVENALDILAAPTLQLVRLASGAGRSRYDSMSLNRETGVPSAKDVARYSIPAQRSNVSIPVEFFTRGWIQVMTDSEIWNWLVRRHRARTVAPPQTSAAGLRLDARDRLRWYDLTRDAWDTHQVLGRLGLLTANLELDDRELSKDAHNAMRSAISALRDDLIERAV